ncbi:MAG: hypothetical protein AAF802_16915 [Planctomycetota bacterium]
MNKLRTAAVALLLFGVGIAALTGAAGLLKGFSPTQTITFFLAPSRSELTQLGQPIADALTTYNSKHGAYPPSLLDAGVTVHPTFYGEWRYRVSEGGQSCTLAVGDYSRYLFEVWWTPEKGWYIDS